MNSAASTSRDHRRAEVGARDHRLPPDGVEQPPEQQRPEEVADREDDQEVPGRSSRRRRRTSCEDRPEVEGDAVVEERLADEEREAEDRAPRVALEGGPGDLAERDRLALADRDRLAPARAARSPVSACDVALDLADDPLGLLLAPVDEQPARALGHVAADEQDRRGRAPRRCANASRQPTFAAKSDCVEEQDRGAGADRGADPVACR